MKNLWNIDDYQDALSFAARAHADQKMFCSGNVSYLLHVTAVAAEVINVYQLVASSDYVASAIQTALLHDVLEDTSVTYGELLLKFGNLVADSVQALTKDKRLPREDRMEDSLARILRQPSFVSTVKACDRIVNLSSVPECWSAEKIVSYNKESVLILHELDRNLHGYTYDRLFKAIRGYNA